MLLEELGGSFHSSHFAKYDVHMGSVNIALGMVLELTNIMSNAGVGIYMHNDIRIA